MLKIWHKVIDNFDDYKISEIQPEGYNDITSVYNWIKISSFLFKDYKYIRRRLQEIAALEWEILSNHDKIEICQVKATSEENCKLILGEDYNYWMTDFGLKSTECRKCRYEMGISILCENITYESRFLVLNMINNTNFEDLYIRRGIEGTNDGDPIPALFNLLESNGGYEGNGFIELDLIMLTEITKEQLRDKIMDCLRNGNY